MTIIEILNSSQVYITGAVIVLVAITRVAKPTWWAWIPYRFQWLPLFVGAVAGAVVDLLQQSVVDWKLVGNAALVAAFAFFGLPGLLSSSKRAFASPATNTIKTAQIRVKAEVVEAKRRVDKADLQEDQE